MTESSVRRIVAACLVFLFSLVPLVAQSDPYAFVIYAEGFNMSIYRNDTLESYDVLVDDVIGMPLLPGDLVQTDAGTFVELQVMPSRTVVKVAENTTFEIERLGGAGGGTFNMSYGRVRARVERITSNETFEVRGFSAVAGVRGTDFGYDMVVEREASNELQTNVYVFEGEVEVSEAAAVAGADGAEPGDPATGDGPSDGASTAGDVAEPQRVTIRANEMVNVVSTIPAALQERAEDLAAPGEDGEAVPAPSAPPVQKVSFTQETIRQDIQQFWDRQDFQEEAIDPSEVEKVFPGINARVERLSDERRQYEELQRLRREGLLGSTEELLADATEELEEQEPERRPDPVALGGPAPSDQVERLIQPEAGPATSLQLRKAGHWFLGTGVLLGGAGVASAWYFDDARTPDDLAQSGVATGMVGSGGVLLTSAIFSYLFSLVAD
jgi:hypothetical protein